ncbi:MAG: hypothetical protein IKU86_04950 [Thermoguttaceae bacterium]|nr:hypothetical protein [Thermoguttaceae bacterium]
MFAAIVSQQNPRVKNAARLRESRARRREGLFLIDGAREAVRAWERGFKFVEVFWNAGKNVAADEKVDVDSALSAARARAGKSERDADAVEKRFDELRTLLRTVDAAGVPTIPLSTGAFEKIGFGDRDEGIVVVARAKTTTFDALDSLLSEKSAKTGEAPLVAVIEGVEKPGNVGAILRSADGAGLDALIVAAPDYDLYNPNAIRSSLGAIFSVPTVVAPAPEVLGWLRRRKIQRATALCDDSIPYPRLDYRRPTAIVLGSEADGLTEIWATETPEDAADGLLKKARLPMLGIADSLNVSNAAAVFFYEARRVRSFG